MIAFRERFGGKGRITAVAGFVFTRYGKLSDTQHLPKITIMAVVNTLQCVLKN
jgi:hypothetical protein